MSVVDYLIERARRAAGQYRPPPAALAKPLRGARALEIGGPSPVFASDGRLPVYAVVASVDGVQFSASTHWHGDMGAGDYHVPGEAARGRLYIVDGAHLAGFDAESYDAVLSSHVVEHLANPLAALRAWVRVLRPGGHLLTVAPHMEGSFDHRRPVTPLAHMVQDEERAAGEDDLTHLEESLALHDRRRDVPWDDAEFATARRDNANTRLLHHHVFVTETLLTMLDHVGLELLGVAARRPHDIFVLARRPPDGAPVDNRAWLSPDAAWRRDSPFSRDRRRAAA